MSARRRLPPALPVAPDPGHGEAGLSLVELLVAVALGAMLMAGAVSLFVNNRQTYAITNDMARLQENARFALDVMTQDIRMAGHTGCGNVVANLTNNLNREAEYVVGQASDFGSTFDAGGSIIRSGSNAVEGFDSGGTQWLPSTNPGEDTGTLGRAILAGDGANYPAVDANSDGITVRYVAGNRSAVTVGVPPVRYINNEVVNGSPDLQTAEADISELNRRIVVRDLTYDLSDNQAAVISHCGAGDVFLMDGGDVDGGGPEFIPTSTNTDVVNATVLSRAYGIDSRPVVSPLAAARYFVRANGAGVPTLHRSGLDQADAFGEITEALVEGVQTLQVLYGFDGRDQDRVAELWLRADQVGDVANPGGSTDSVGLAGPDGAGRHDGLAGLVAVRIGLLMVTVDEFRKESTERGSEFYDVLDERFCSATTAADVSNNCTVTFPDDGRRRRTFTTTVAVRNFQ